MNNFNALLKKGFEYHKKNNFKKALKIYKKLISIDETNPQLKLFLGTLYLQIEEMEIEDDQKEPGTIVQEVQKGFMIKERLLRPSLVGVSKKTVNKDDKTEENKENLDK